MSRPSNGQKWHAGAEAPADDTEGKVGMVGFRHFSLVVEVEDPRALPIRVAPLPALSSVVDPTKPEHLIQTAYQRGAPVHQDRVDLSN
jgi:hypothetical protein